jgi:predicted nucleic acid-binding protein
VILVDTSVWIDHLRRGNATLAGLLDQRLVLAHSWVIGELALGNLRSRQDVLALLHGLPQASAATDREALTLIERHRLFGSGIGYVDAQLLAATRLTPDAMLWTFDRKLSDAASDMGVDASAALD